MKIREVKNQFVSNVASRYTPREAENIFKIIHEDVFHLAETWSDADNEKLQTIIERLNMHEPIQYILQQADFYGLKFSVNSHVLIPRPETEELVHHIIHSNRKHDLPIDILDIGTGSGCIAVALKKNIPSAKITAIDIAENALSVARENAKLNSTDIDFLQTDFTDELNWQQLNKYDIIVSNPPYITRQEFSELDAHVKNFEPHTALIAAHSDPFIFYEKIALFGARHLRENGKIYCELNASASPTIEQIFHHHQYTTQVLKDLQGKDRMLMATK